METKQLNPMEDPAYKKMLEDVKTARKKREIRGSAPYGMTTVTGKRGRLSPEGRESVKKLSAININL